MLSFIYFYYSSQPHHNHLLSLTSKEPIKAGQEERIQHIKYFTLSISFRYYLLIILINRTIIVNDKQPSGPTI